MGLGGIIFDMDGTLVDSALDFAAIRSEIGLSDRQPILEGIEEIADGPDRERAFEILWRHEREGSERASPFPGVAELLEELGRRQILTAVLTRNSRVSTDATFARLGWSFSRVITREDAPTKPDPSGVLEICRGWSVSPADVLVVGDYLFDIQAGRNAGTRTVLFAVGESPEYAGLADWVISRFEELPGIIEELTRK